MRIIKHALYILAFCLMSLNGAHARCEPLEAGETIEKTEVPTGYERVVVFLRVPRPKATDFESRPRNSLVRFWFEGSVTEFVHYRRDDKVPEMQHCTFAAKSASGREVVTERTYVRILGEMIHYFGTKEHYVLAEEVLLPAELVARKQKAQTSLNTGVEYTGSWNWIEKFESGKMIKLRALIFGDMPVVQTAKAVKSNSTKPALSKKTAVRKKKR